MPDGNKHLKDSGITLIDILVGCAALALVGCIVLPGLAKERDDARTAECADHQKQLAHAAHQYAADFEGKFFYNRSQKIDHNGQLKPGIVGRWYDKQRVGRYLDGEPMFLAWKSYPYPKPPEDTPENPPPDWPSIGIGGGVFVCPSDGEDSGRSYDMNFWAGTGYSLHPNEKKRWSTGTLFDSNTPGQDQLLLFTDVIGFTPTARGWVSSKHFGLELLPGQRFGGMEYPPHRDRFRRYKDNQRFYTRLDYVRHGINQDPSAPQGAVNIAYADGHVGLRRSDQLFDSTTKLSTYDTLWSPIDRELEDRENANP